MALVILMQLCNILSIKSQLESGVILLAGMVVDIFVIPEINWPVIVIACCFMLLDIVTGFVSAVVNKCVDSSKMKMGMWHKCGFLLAIGFGVLCEYSVNYIDLGFTLPIQDAVCVYIILTELVSILENLGQISPSLASAEFMSIFKRKEE